MTSSGSPSSCSPQSGAPFQEHGWHTSSVHVEVHDRDLPVRRCGVSDSGLMQSSSSSTPSPNSSATSNLTPVPPLATDPVPEDYPTQWCTKGRKMRMMGGCRAIREQSDDLPSIGSSLHSVGECTECSFFRRGKCRSGASCTYCHVPHEQRVRPGVRARRRAERNALEAAAAHDLGTSAASGPATSSTTVGPCPASSSTSAPGRSGLPGEQTAPGVADDGPPSVSSLFSVFSGVLGGREEAEGTTWPSTLLASVFGRSENGDAGAQEPVRISRMSL